MRTVIAWVRKKCYCCFAAPKKSTSFSNNNYYSRNLFYLKGKSGTFGGSCRDPGQGDENSGHDEKSGTGWQLAASLTEACDSSTTLPGSSVRMRMLGGRLLLLLLLLLLYAPA